MYGRPYNFLLRPEMLYFKRFKISDTIKKNLSKIVYPIKGLDMSNYVP